ncbi:1352_t:CDS:2, partial [Gigaspora rosea]
YKVEDVGGLIADVMRWVHAQEIVRSLAQILWMLFRVYTVDEDRIGSAGLSLAVASG